MAPGNTRRVHEDLGRQRQPIGDDEIEFLESAFPDDDIFRVDIEGSRLDMTIARGFSGGVSLQLRIPWIEIGAPQWDSIAESFHENVPAVDHYVRDLFPRGQTFFYVRSDGRSVLLREEIATSGVGDIALSLGVPLKQRGRIAQRLALTVEFPTGDETTLHGSGGHDAGIRWFLSREGFRNDVLIAAGYTWLDPAGSLLGFRRRDTFHASADYFRRITPRTSAHAGVRIDTSPLAGTTNMNLADPVIFYRFGFGREIRHAQWLAIDLGEEIAPQMGVDADFSLQLSWSTRSRGN